MQIYGARRMPRFIVLVLMMMIFVPSLVSAKDMADKYIDVNLPDLTKFSAHYNTFDIKDNASFIDYLKITECNIYTSISKSQFKLQAIQQDFLNYLAKNQKNDKELFFRIPVTFQVSGYNFDTQSLTVIPNSQFRKVNMLELTRDQTPVCQDEDNGSIKTIPAYYNAKLNFPVSLYRIPLQKNIAESLFLRLEPTYSNPNIRIVYGYLLVQIEAIQPETKKVMSYTHATVRGQLNALDLFIDRNRKVLLKRLDYAEGF
jgi:Domain of unknown function (DUF4852)